MATTIKNKMELEAAEQAYYAGTEWNGKTGDQLLNCIRAYNGGSYKSVDFSPEMGIPNKALVKKMTPKSNY